jgi:MoaA/NifB/PqqE/SkfB family radical SAM enzyme
MNEKIIQIVDKLESRTGSRTFCPLPWIHLATRPNGDARLCCVTNASGAQTGDHTVGLVKNVDGRPANFGRDLPLDAFNNEYMQSVRKTMLAGQVPASCTKCFEEESNGVFSKRMWESYEWMEEGLDLEGLVENTKEDGIIPAVVPYWDLRLGHTCNLKCVMCSPHDSSRWVQDHKELVSITKSPIILKQVEWGAAEFDNYWYERPEFWEQVFDQIPNIRQLYFAGGEPLMIKEHRRFLEEIIRRGYSKQISLRYNSNGVLVNQDMIDIWSEFRQVRYAFSIDDYDQRNHYIRYPADWTEIEQSLRLLDRAPAHIHTSIACAVQALNIKNVTNFARWKLEQGFEKINKFRFEDFESGGGIINMHLLYIPTFLSARILPKEDKQEVRENFMEFKDWLWNNYRQDDNFWQVNPYGWKRYEAILKFVEAQDHTHLLPDFQEYIRNLDKIRGTDSKSVFPDLAHLL